MSKKIGDITKQQRLRDSKEIADQAVEDLHNTSLYVSKLKDDLADANKKIKHLEDLLNNVPMDTCALKPHEEEIILVELKRMYDRHVLSDIPLDEKEDLKKLDTLVKCLVALRSTTTKKQKKEKTMSVDEALSLVKSEFQ